MVTLEPHVAPVPNGERCRIGLFGLRQTHWQVQASWKGLQVRLQGVCQWVANSLDLEISKPGMKDCCKHHRGRDLAITISYKSLWNAMICLASITIPTQFATFSHRNSPASYGSVRNPQCTLPGPQHPACDDWGRCRSCVWADRRDRRSSTARTKRAWGHRDTKASMSRIIENIFDMPWLVI